MSATVQHPQLQPRVISPSISDEVAEIQAWLLEKARDWRQLTAKINEQAEEIKSLKEKLEKFQKKSS